jgi:hypothetical protein
MGRLPTAIGNVRNRTKKLVYMFKFVFWQVTYNDFKGFPFEPLIGLSLFQTLVLQTNFVLVYL